MKILAVDIGNTNIVLGVFEDGVLTRHWRLATRKRSTPDEYAVLLRSLFVGAGLEVGAETPPIRVLFGGAAISCVVPSLTRVFVEALSAFHNGEVIVVGPGIKTGMKILTDDPREVGADRIVNAVAAFDLFKGATIVVDFGTAVTFDYINPAGEYGGGAIAPGISIATDALFQRTARLPRVEILRPEHLVGTSTTESLKAGIFYGYVSMVEGIVKRMKAEVGTTPRVIATGGFTGLIANDCPSIDEVDEFLTLKGLQLIYEVNS